MGHQEGGATIALIIGLLVLWCLQGYSSFLAGVCVWSLPICGLTFNIRCPVYFTIGLACSLYAPKALPRYTAFIAIPLALCALVFYKQEVFSGKEMKVLMSFITTVLMALAIWCITPTQKWPAIFTANAFPIVVIHHVVVYLLPIPMKAFGVWNIIFSRVGFLPIFVITVMLTIVATELIKRCWPTFAKLAFGGR